jgi:hypothetical protein
MTPPPQFDYEARYKELRAERKRLREAEEAKRKKAEADHGRACAHDLITGVLSDIKAGRTERFTTPEGQRHLQHLIDLGIPF